MSASHSLLQSCRVQYKMATKPPIVCPLCNEEMKANQCLEDHLVDDHTKRELARHAVSYYEMEELGSVQE